MPHVIKFENVRVLRDGQLQDTYFWVEDGTIIDPQTRFWAGNTEGEVEADEVVDGKGCILAPGFIDVQINGAYGYDFSDPTITEEQIESVAQGLVSTGVTAFCPTIISSDADTYRALMAKFPRTNDGEKRNKANMLGLHLEGPFLNPRRKGAHKEEVLTTPSTGVLARYGTLENTALVTLAPELEGAPDAIRELCAQGIVVSAGHSDAHFDKALEGVHAGITMLTHIFNAMSPFHHRDPGLIGLTGITEKRPFYGIILDGIHSHHSSVRIVQACHPDGLVLITDAMAGMGLPPGTFALAGKSVDVTDHGAYLTGTDTIAGSVVTLDSCVRKLIEYCDCSVVEALEDATLHPALALGIEKKKGTLNFGADADFVLLDASLHVKRTFIAGKLVYDNFE